MSSSNIVITRRDRDQLDALLSSGFANAIGPLDNFGDLKKELATAQVVAPDAVPQDVITMNSKITLRDLDTNEAETYTLVYPQDADIANNRLSILAPIGTAILGQRVGDELRWRVPAGWRRLKIEHVDYQPEREGAFHL